MSRLETGTGDARVADVAASAMAVTVTVTEGDRSWTRAELTAEARTLADALMTDQVRVLATLMDNGAAWIVADQAAALAGVVHLPLPAFFTPAQMLHAVTTAGADTLLTLPQAAPAWQALAAGAAGAAISRTVAGKPLCVLRLNTRAATMPAGTGVITFTSGTTGTPKGVCLGRDALQAVAQGLVQTLAPLGLQRHLSALPYAVLLEHVAGVLAPWQQGSCTVALPLAEVGVSGSSAFDPARLQAAVLAHGAHSVIVLPQMLRAWVGWLRATGQRAPPSLQLVAVGGAAVGAPLIAAAQALGLPACEGYGLSEAGSVQALNLPPGAGPAPTARPGSVGRALPHARVRVAADGEIEVAGSLFLGYLDDAQNRGASPASEPAPASTPAPGAWWPSGDLGEIDADGFVHVLGRKKQVLITAYGRNVSPEWVETALRGHDAIAQAVVLGDGQPMLSAVLWPMNADATDAALQAAVDAANASLPDYARIGRWVRARAAFTAGTGLATSNGRPLRKAIETLHADVLHTPELLELP